MATIKDVAKRAGVSTTTVSHVINKTRFVAEETRNAVWEAIKELHYSPSAVARSLKVNHTKTLGLLATSSEAPYFAEIIEAVENHCFERGYTLILGNAHNDLQKQRAYLSMMAQKRVDGLLVMCSEYPDDLLQMLEENRNIPMVVMDWAPHAATSPIPCRITPSRVVTWPDATLSSVATEISVRFRVRWNATRVAVGMRASCKQ